MNILFLMTDSLIPMLTGPYGDPFGSTPTLDKLAAAGIVFKNAYSNSPLCAPSRASMVTGRYVSEIGVFDNANEFSSEWPTLGHALRAAGYEAVIIGKMHFVGYDQWHGFSQRLALETDYSTGYSPQAYTMAWLWDQEPQGNPVGKFNMSPSYVASEEWEHYPMHYERDNETQREAVKYLSEKTRDSDPFFCCVSYHAPHNPFWIPEEFRAPFRGKPLPFPRTPPGAGHSHGPMDDWLNIFHWVPEIEEQLNKPENLQWMYETYYGMVLDLDRRIAELLALLEKNGLREETAIVVTSDHGDMLGVRGMVQKRAFYEQSARVPLIFSFPGHWKQGIQFSNPASLIDLLPTLCEFVRVPEPSGLPGKSLLPSLVDGEELPTRTVFGEYHGEGVHAPCFMMVRDGCKYIYVDGCEERLYDLVHDPEEQINLASDNAPAARIAEMRSELLQTFDPGAIAKKAILSQRSRRYILQCETAAGDA